MINLMSSWFWEHCPPWQLLHRLCWPASSSSCRFILRNAFALVPGLLDLRLEDELLRFDRVSSEDRVLYDEL